MKRKKYLSILTLSMFILAITCMTGCREIDYAKLEREINTLAKTYLSDEEYAEYLDEINNDVGDAGNVDYVGNVGNTETTEAIPSSVSSGSTYDILKTIPKYDGNAYVLINDNKPFFSNDDLKLSSFESYSDLDDLGRCGTAYALIGPETLPTEERGEIGSVKPTGWHTVKYNGIDGNYLYNRCHLIAFCLAGENANPKNLITGTRYLNINGMLPFETDVVKYVEKTANHVLYRVTPIFDGNNLVANGVLMEAYSIEDDGAGIKFCVYCYNVQPDITIDYLTGDSTGPSYTGN